MKPNRFDLRCGGPLLAEMKTPDFRHLPRLSRGWPIGTREQNNERAGLYF